MLQVCLSRFPDACYKCVYLDVAYVSHIRCMCFIWMFAYGCNVFQVFFQVFQKHVSSVSTTFRRMLQLLYLDVSKVDRVLHLSSPSSAASSLPAPAGHLDDARARAFRIGGVTCPSPPCHSGNVGLVWSTNRSAARERSDASTV